MVFRKWLLKLTRRQLIRVGSFGLALVMLLAISTASGFLIARQYRTELEYTYQRALENLGDSMKNINVTLSKGIYATTPNQISEISSSLSLACSNAKSSISQLPAFNPQLQNLNKYISQVGSYALALSRKINTGAPLSEEERNNLYRLSKLGDTASSQIQDMISLMNEGRLFNGDVKRSIYVNKSKVITAVSENVKDIEDGFNDYPTLIYDGPFSDHIMQQKPRLTEGKKEITKLEALQKASKILGIPQDRLLEDGEEKSNLPSYCFIDDKKTSISISRKGGYLVYLIGNREIGKETIGTESAVNKALEFLKKIGIDQVKSSYYTNYDGICTINFAYYKDDIIYYTDLIKIDVALDSGEILGADLRGFIMNHYDRDLSSPKFSMTKAKTNLSPALAVKSSNLCVIPSLGFNEIFCFEFVCKGKDNEDILVYVNTQTGLEEQIQILMHTPNGTLAM